MNVRMLELLAVPLRAVRRATLWWALGLAALVAMTMSVWPAFKGSSGISQAIDQLPSGVVQAFGLQDFGTPAGFLRANLYDFFVPLLLAVAAVTLVSGQTASEEAAGRLELYLAQPVGRRAVLLGRVVAALVVLIVISAVLLLAQLASDATVNLSIDTGLVLSTVVLSALLALSPWQPRGRDRRPATAPVSGAECRPGRGDRRMRSRLSVPPEQRACALATPLSLGLGVRRQPAGAYDRAVAIRGAGRAVNRSDGRWRLLGYQKRHRGSLTRNPGLHGLR